MSGKVGYVIQRQMAEGEWECIEDSPGWPQHVAENLIKIAREKHNVVARLIRRETTTRETVFEEPNVRETAT